MRLALITFFFISQNIFSQQLKISGEIVGLENSDVIFGYYYGEKQYIKDTISCVNGKFVISSRDNVDKGVYFILLNDNQNFQILINEDLIFSFKTNISEIISEMKFINSDENSKFYEFQKFTSKKNYEVLPLKNKLEAITKDDSEYSEIFDKIEKINQEVINFKNNFIEKNLNSFFVKLLKSNEQITIPKDFQTDEKSKYFYFINNFWNNFDLSDSRMLFTPIFHSRLEDYISKYTPQIPDSINKYLDILLSKVRASDKLFEYIINWSTYKYESSKIMGHDAIFVHIVYKYFMTGQVNWIDDVKLTNIIDKAMRLNPNLIGKKAPFLKLKNEYDEYKDLHKITSDYTVLSFYDPDCGHCKKEIPKIKKITDKFSRKVVQVYAVCTEFDSTIWRQFIKKNELEKWINVIDIENQSNFRRKYNIMGTPRLYLLDKNKVIIAKQIDSSTLEEILNKRIN